MDEASVGIGWTVGMFGEVWSYRAFSGDILSLLPSPLFPYLIGGYVGARLSPWVVDTSDEADGVIIYA